MEWKPPAKAGAALRCAPRADRVFCVSECDIASSAPVMKSKAAGARLLPNRTRHLGQDLSEVGPGCAQSHDGGGADMGLAVASHAVEVS